MRETRQPQTILNFILKNEERKCPVFLASPQEVLGQASILTDVPYFSFLMLTCLTDSQSVILN